MSKEVTFYFTAKSSVTLELSEEEIKALQANKQSKLLSKIINQARNQHDEESSSIATDWEMDNDDYFEIEE